MRYFIYTFLLLLTSCQEDARWSVLDTEIPGPALLGRGVSLMQSGEVFLAGGAQYGNPPLYVDIVQKYDPQNDSYISLRPLPTGRYNAQAEPLPSGKILVFGGFGGDYLSEALIYDPRTDFFSNAKPMPFPTQSHASAVLNNGDIISFGGSNSGGYLNNSIIYRESVNDWIHVKELPEPLTYLAAAKLKDGRVLVVGGRGSRYSPRAYIYDPAADDYTRVRDAPVAMRGGFLETLSTGVVVYGAGEIDHQNYSTLAYYYFPNKDAWLTSEQMPDGRAFGDSVALTDGTVLVFGGNKDPSGQISTVLKRTP